jgi:hypothetical protein
MPATYSNNFKATDDVRALPPRALAREVYAHPDLFDVDGPALDHPDEADENYREFLEALRADENLTLGAVRNAAGDAVSDAVAAPAWEQEAVPANAMAKQKAQTPDFDPGLGKIRRDQSPTTRARNRRHHQREIMLMQARKMLRDLGIPLRKLGNAFLPEHAPQFKRCLKKPRIRAQLAQLLDA